MNTVSINKYISGSGYCSRREADRYIEMGRVCINGILAQKGNRVSNKDVVTVDGEKIRHSKKRRAIYIALYKPKGIVCTTDSKEPQNIIRYMDYATRLFPIGRLDKLSTGLILLTNDGDIVNKILRAGNQHEKEYVVSVDKKISWVFIEKMSAGVPILGTKTKRCKVNKINDYTFSMVLVQGLNRQIRRMCEYLGYKVTKLHRKRIMHISIQTLAYGKWRYLTDKEINELHARTIFSKK